MSIRLGTWYKERKRIDSLVTTREYLIVFLDISRTSPEKEREKERYRSPESFGTINELAQRIVGLYREDPNLSLRYENGVPSNGSGFENIPAVQLGENFFVLSRDLTDEEFNELNREVLKALKGK